MHIFTYLHLVSLHFCANAQQVILPQTFDDACVLEFGYADDYFFFITHTCSSFYIYLSQDFICSTYGDLSQTHAYTCVYVFV